MASGTINGTTSNGYITAQLVWSSAAQATGNTSTLTVTFRLKKSASSTSATSGQASWSIRVGSRSYAVSGSFTIPNDGAWHTVRTLSGITVAHDAEGRASVALSVTGGLPNTSYKTTDLAGTAVLDTLVRASAFTLDVSEQAIGGAVVLTLDPVDGACTHTVRWQLGDLFEEQTLAAGKTETAFTLPEGWLDALPDQVTGAATVTLTTLKNGTALGSVRRSLTVTVPDSVVPTVGETVLRRTGAVPETWDLWVQGVSGAVFEVTGSQPGRGATLQQIRLEGGGAGATGSILRTGPLQTSGVIPFTATVTDSRGRTAQAVVEAEVAAYHAPKITFRRVERCLADGTASDEGTFLKAEMAAEHTALGGLNTLTMTVQMRRPGGQWSAAAATDGVLILGGDLDPSEGCELCFTAQDLLTATAVVDTVPQAQVYLHKAPERLGIGCYANTAPQVAVGYPVVAHGDVTVEGTFTVAGQALEDSGWVELTLEDGYAPYNGLATNTPKVRRWGPLVQLVGMTQQVFCRLPEGYRPLQTVTLLCQGSSYAAWVMQITAAGNVSAGRYRLGDTFTTPNTSAWLPFSITYMTA